jgi:MFS family permease
MTRLHATHNVAILALCQAVSMSGSVMVLSVVALAGKALAPDPAWATVPLGIQFLAMMLGTVPASLTMGAIGRRAGFSLGQGLGAVGALLAAWAMLSGSFWLFVAAAVPIGIHTAFFQYLRFAAADTADSAFRPRAIAYVMAGGVVAAILGPALARGFVHALPAVFAGPYLALAVLCAVNIVALQFIRMPRPAAGARSHGGRPLAVIARQPIFIVAVLSAMVGYGVMNLLMVAMPLAMTGNGFSFADTTGIIRWHVLGMFVPSFFTGSLIQRFGVTRIIAAGATLLLGSLTVGGSGMAYANFWAALVLLGVGWNFMFLGGTTLLIEAYAPEERAKTQAFNDFLVFSTTAVTSFTSGAVQNLLGWQAVSAVSAPPVLVALAAILWLRTRQRRMPVAVPAGATDLLLAADEECQP